MAHNRSFKLPSMAPQDLALIMELVSPPQLGTNVHAEGKAMKARRFQPEEDQSTAPNLRESDGDISSSGMESEDEVNAEVGLGPGPDVDDKLRASA